MTMHNAFGYYPGPSYALSAYGRRIVLPRIQPAPSPRPDASRIEGGLVLNGEGTTGFVLANCSMSSYQSGEGGRRRALFKANLAISRVALPGQHFYRTPFWKN